MCQNNINELTERIYDILMDTGEALTFDAVVLATPSFVAGNLLAQLDSKISQQLHGIPYTSTATVSLAYPLASLSNAHSLKGFGFVILCIYHLQSIAFNIQFRNSTGL